MFDTPASLIVSLGGVVHVTLTACKPCTVANEVVFRWVTAPQSSAPECVDTDGLRKATRRFTNVRKRLEYKIAV